MSGKPFTDQKKNYKRDNHTGKEEQKYDHCCIHGYLLSLSCLQYTTSPRRSKFGSSPILDEGHTHLSPPQPADFAPHLSLADGELAPCP